MKDVELKIMERFLKIALELGWKQVAEGIMVFQKTGKDGYININFIASNMNEDFDLYGDLVDVQFVHDYMTIISSCTKVKEESLEWAIPLLISEYFGYKMDMEKATEWARKAIKVKPELASDKAFSDYIVTKL